MKKYILAILSLLAFNINAQQAGNLTIGGIGILGTNQMTMTSTGYTNNNTYDVRVFNLQGTTIIFSNSVSKGNAIIGTIAVNNDFLTLHPHEMLYGTGMSGSIIQ